MYLKRIPPLFFPLAKKLTFELKGPGKAIYLTFDDGPHPTLTPLVLDMLDEYNAKATFFLIGKNAAAYPDLVEEIVRRKHSIGLHGYEHLSGWKTQNTDYFNDVARCAAVVPSLLFRPPYGQITPVQVARMQKEYEIVMWSHLCGDWDARYSAEQCASFATNKVKPGSIIVFHESDKALPRMPAALRMALDYYRSHGFTMEAITTKLLQVAHRAHPLP